MVVFPIIGRKRDLITRDRNVQ